MACQFIFSVKLIKLLKTKICNDDIRKVAA